MIYSANFAKNCAVQIHRYSKLPLVERCRENTNKIIILTAFSQIAAPGLVMDLFC